MTIEKAIRKLIETYIEAKENEFIRDKVAWHGMEPVSGVEGIERWTTRVRNL